LGNRLNRGDLPLGKRCDKQDSKYGKWQRWAPSVRPEDPGGTQVSGAYSKQLCQGLRAKQESLRRNRARWTQSHFPGPLQDLRPATLRYRKGHARHSAVVLRL